MTTKSAALLLLLWLSAAGVAVGAGLLAWVPPPVLVLVLATTATTLALAFPPAREWVQAADLRLFLLPHLVRFVGLVFLVLVARGVLVPAFTPIGWGDFASAVGAVALLLVGPPGARHSPRWWAWLLWNTFGLADMALLIVTGIHISTSAPEQFSLFRQLPLGLLPTFAVPLIIATHVLIFTRLFARRPKPAA